MMTIKKIGVIIFIAVLIVLTGVTAGLFLMRDGGLGAQASQAAGQIGQAAPLTAATLTAAAPWTSGQAAGTVADTATAEMLSKNNLPQVNNAPQAKQPAAPTQANGLNSGLVPAQTPALAPGSTLVPLPSPMAAPAWGQPPACANQPVSSEGLAQALTANPSANPDMDYRRAVRLVPALGALPSAQFSALLADRNAETTVYTRRALISLAVNVATGRLNRASLVNFADLPGVKTVGDLLAQMEPGLNGATVPPAVLKAVQLVESGQGITQPVCAHLLVTQTGLPPADLQWSAAGVTSLAGTQPTVAAVAAAPAFDGVITAPDGRWAAYTSVGSDSGGPVYLRDLTTGAWVNLIQKINGALPGGQTPLAETGWWDVIGWMPDSRQLMLGQADASAVWIANIDSGQVQVIPFKSGGAGGEMIVGLAPDGSRFVYVGENEAGDGQVLSLFNLSGGETSALVSIPYADGSFFFPRFAPDGQSIAFVVQKGRPDTGYTYAINRLRLDNGAVQTLMEGNLGLSQPVWSPDGRYLAFSRRDAAAPVKPDPTRPFDQPVQNVWVIDLSTGQAQAVTNLAGQALRPQWAPDARTLSFVTHDGQVGLVRVDAPNQIWRAGPPAAAGGPAAVAPARPGEPNFSSAAFVP